MRLFRVQVNSTVTVRTDRVAGVLRVPLAVGQNYVANPFEPSARTLAGALPPALLPAASSETAATTVTFWNRAAQSLSTPSWNCSNPSYSGWRVSGSFDDANDTPVDPDTAMIITLRSSAGARMLYLTGTVPSAVSSNLAVQASGYTLVSAPYAGEIALVQSGLTASGFQGAANPSQSDQLLFFDASTGVFSTKLWYHTASSAWMNAADNSVSTRTLLPGEPVLLRRRGASGFTWTVPRPYASP